MVCAQNCAASKLLNSAKQVAPDPDIRLTIGACARNSVKTEVTIEIEGEDKPALVAEWLSVQMVA